MRDLRLWVYRGVGTSPRIKTHSEEELPMVKKEENCTEPVKQEVIQEQNKVVDLNKQDLRLIRRMAELMPLNDPITKEKPYIDKLEFSKITTFITPRSIAKELAFYYLYHNQVIDYVSVFSAEEIKNIYFDNYPGYKSIDEVGTPIIVVLLGKELYNKEMINSLNLFVDHFTRLPQGKALVFVYEGTNQEFKNKYKNELERGILNSGKTLSFNRAAKVKAVPEL